jgi:hypothetical protein
MHGHGYAMLALASALGTTRDGGVDTDLRKRVFAVLQKAVVVAEQSQTGTGGWGYEPDSATEHEGSVTVTIAQGLRAARDAGVRVSDQTVRNGLRYLDKIQKREPPGSSAADEDGSFKYSLTQERSSYALTSAAVSSFFLFGEYGQQRKDAIERGVAYIKRRLPSVLAPRSDEGFFFYGNFYAAWAAWQRDGDAPETRSDQSWGTGDASGLERTTQFWGPWHANVYPHLLALQQVGEEGKWAEHPVEAQRFQFGDLLPTTFAVLTLAIPDEEIPIFQR